MAESALLQLEIQDVAFGGKGVARHDGKVYFVPFTIPGEKITARVLRQKKNFGEAELLHVETASPDRTEPPCPYFGRCGGCSYQHIAYDRQLAIKAAQVEQTLRRVGRLESVPMQPIVGAPHPYGYRNRIRVHSGGGVTGFFCQRCPGAGRCRAVPAGGAGSESRLAPFARNACGGRRLLAARARGWPIL